MRSKIMMVLLFLAIFTLPGLAQKNLNAGIGYFGEKVTRPGVVLALEFEKFHAASLSLPLSFQAGYCNAPDYQFLFLDLQKGLRKYFDGGLFVEQGLGIGLIATDYKENGVWYRDQHRNLIFPYDGLNLGFMPSATFGLGYKWANEKQGDSQIWVRSKIYWNLGFRGLEAPYGALMVGFTHTLKTK